MLTPQIIDTVVRAALLEDAATTNVPLNPSFADIDDASNTLNMTIVGNTMPALFSNISIDAVTHVLHFTPAPNAIAEAISNLPVSTEMS